MKYWQECYNTRVAKDEVDELFSLMDIDCDVMVHSSLPDIGNIKRLYVTDNLKEYVLDKGFTVLCPALPIKGSSLDYLKSTKVFDVRTAPNAMGSISSYYGHLDSARRSLSPTHSVVAYGSRAVYYTEEHHLSETPFSRLSPYFKLLQNKGKILMFGASLKNLTFCHIIEEMIGEEAFPVQVYDSRRFEVELIDETGAISKGFFRAHSQKISKMRDTKEIMGIIRELPSTKVFSIGCGEAILLDAKDVCLCFLSQLKSGLSTIGRVKVSERCKREADFWINYVNSL